MNALEYECLVLNRSWVAIGVETVQSALSKMASGAAKAMDFTGESCIPVAWKDWFSLPVRDNDDAIHTTKVTIRAPRVIVLTKYSRVPTKRRRMSMRNVMEYHNHTCAYTGKHLTKGNRSLDHVIPKSRGGKTSWDNIVPCDRALNSLKANKTPQEAGLQLKFVPHEPRRVPFTEILKKREMIFEEWKLFVKQ